jgi:hypothetical protein
MTTQLIAEDVVSSEVPRNRQTEIQRYLALFGYKPRQTILEVYLAGSLRWKPRSPAPRPVLALSDVPGVVVVGKSYDPVLGFRLVRPETRANSTEPWFLGYLSPKDGERRPPHELLPVDFTPPELAYPLDWRKMFGTRGFLVALSAPSGVRASLASLSMKLRRIGPSIDVKERWGFLDELERCAPARK